MVFLVKYWKEIALVLLALALISVGVWVRGVIAERDTAQAVIKQKDEALKLKDENIKQRDGVIALKDDQMKNYLALQSKLQTQKDAALDSSNKTLKRYIGVLKGLPTQKTYTTIRVRGGIKSRVLLVPGTVATLANMSTVFRGGAYP
jgi:hypothetical protein